MVSHVVAFATTVMPRAATLANIGSTLARSAPLTLGTLKGRQGSPLRALGRLAMSIAPTPGSKPILYVYDHCPFCVRARIIFGLKKIPVQVVWLDNDDVETPTELVGKKVVPILDMIGKNGKRVTMPESMDIVRRMDEDDRWGPKLLKDASGRTDIADFFTSVADLQRRLTRPRFARSAVLPEFRKESARLTFIKNHPLKPPSDYDENFANTPELLATLNAKLQELEPMIHSPDYVTEGGVSYDDIDFFGKTRGLTVIKGVQLGPKLKAYLEKFSAKSDVALYYQMNL